MILALQPYLSLTRINRPIGILLLLWPTLIAIWLASDAKPAINIVIVFTLGVIVMRSAGCVINDYADRNFDPHVTRTKNRPLAIKAIPANNALYLFAALLAFAFFLVLQLDLQVILLAVVAALLAIIYPFAKRITHYPQFILSVAFAWSIPMVYMQVTKNLPFEAWILFASSMCWVVAYDTIYAMADIADDLKIGIKSTAITFGKYDKAIIFIFHCVSLFGFAIIGILREIGMPFYGGLLVSSALVVYQQYMISSRQPQRCVAAFINNNYFGASIFIGIVLSLHPY